MRDSKILRVFLVFTALFFFHSKSFSQFIDPSLGDVNFEMVGCDAITHTVSLKGIHYDEATNFFGFRITIDSRSEIFNLDMDYVSDYDETTGRHSNFLWQSYIDFFLSALGCGGLGFGGVIEDVTTPSNPIVAQNIQFFKSVAFSERARPRTAGKRVKKTKKAREQERKEAEEREEEKEEAPIVALRPNEMSSDLESESFEFSGNSGSNFAIRAGYGRTSANGEWTFGAKFILNSLSIEGGDDSFNNNTVNFFANKILLETDTKERSVGASLNFLLLDEKTSESNGAAFALYGVQKFYRGESIIVTGAMFQFTNVGDVSAYYLNVAGMYGLPIGQRFSLNIDGMFTSNLITTIEGESVELESQSILNLGTTVGVHLTEAFGVNVGFKRIFLVKDYSSTELTLGAGFRF